jgi:hypothetical protein
LTDQWVNAQKRRNCVQRRTRDQRVTVTATFAYVNSDPSLATARKT